MPPKPISYANARKKLLSAGFLEVSQVGSHVKFAKRVQRDWITTIVPKHREIPGGTVRSILRQTGISPGEWEQL